MSDDKPKTRRPANTAFKQQRLKAWQPLLTPKSVLPTLFILGVIFAPLGAFLLHTSNSVSELIIDYTDCISAAPSALTAVASSKNIASFNAPGANANADISLQWKAVNSTANGIPQNTCTLQFTLPTTLVAPVFMYYRLTNFYQNHRRYVKSFDAGQLKGSTTTASVVSNCAPLAKPDPNGNAVYYPCGLIADSMFSDFIGNLKAQGGSGTDFEFSDKGIAWPADASKYGTLTGFDANVHLPPPHWKVWYPTGKYPSAPDFATNERFQVWMRTAGLPNFRKLYGRNDGTNLNAGTYQIEIQDNFEVKSFGGTKSLVISTVSFMGGKNPFLGLAYIVVGGICILLAIVFAVRHMTSPRKLGDHTYLSWNHQPPPSTN
ncbi:CDC50/LEM3 family [Blastocladiella britannica]|nr:CDC50/LEM3 family [Blastocladiella britannica]